MPWVISYEYRATFRHQNGVRQNAPTKAITVIDEHPGAFITESHKKFLELYDKPFKPGTVDRADEIITLFSAVEVSVEIGAELGEIL